MGYTESAVLSQCVYTNRRERKSKYIGMTLKTSDKIHSQHTTTIHENKKNRNGKRMMSMNSYICALHVSANIIASVEARIVAHARYNHTS